MNQTQSRARDLPGYRRRIIVEPSDGAVLAMLEDDQHAMAVVLRHTDGQVTSVEPVMDRAPWDSCPGARAKLVETFAGLALSDVTARRDKKQNCTHLHDLAVLAAVHAGDTGPLVYDIAVSDPTGEHRRSMEISRDGHVLHAWIEERGHLVEPASIAGQSLMTMRDWIAALPTEAQESARLLQWAGLVAHGRTIPIERQSRAADLPPNCYSFQPQRAATATRIGKGIDFSQAEREPLAAIGDRERAHLSGDQAALGSRSTLAGTVTAGSTTT